MELSSKSQVVSSRYLVGAEVGEEIILLHLENGLYFGLDDVSARIWKLLQEPTTVGEIERVLLEEYEIDGDRCHEDVVRLLSDLIEQGLVEASDT